MPPALSVVLVAYEMGRELPRTLRSLATGYQRGVAPDDYEVVVVDNGSSEPFDPALFEGFPGTIRSTRLDPAPVSPAAAANLGITMANGRLIGLLIDGARIASPGLLTTALLGARLAARPVVATLGWHLGATEHKAAEDAGYDQAVEDRMLAECGWEDDGYRLFAHSTLAGSSRRGWFGPLGESNALFLTREMWDEVDGLDERFALPGGGLVNHDLLRRACELAGSQLVILLGEGTFHQIHSGASTSGRITRDEAGTEYERLRGRPYEPPADDALYVGRVPASALEHMAYSVRWATNARERGSGGAGA